MRSQCYSVSSNPVFEASRPHISFKRIHTMITQSLLPSLCHVSLSTASRRNPWFKCALLAVLLAPALASGQLAPVLIFKDSFDVSANSSDINFENDKGRQS